MPSNRPAKNTQSIREHLVDAACIITRALNETRYMTEDIRDGTKTNEDLRRGANLAIEYLQSATDHMVKIRQEAG